MDNLTCHSCTYFGTYLKVPYCFSLNEVNKLNDYNRELKACKLYKPKGRKNA